MKSREFIDDERAAFLLSELLEYEKETQMTETERAALHEWVSDGNSVHENGSMGWHEGGMPVDFLEDYRYHEEIRMELEKLSPEERTNYLARLRGEDTIPNLREDLAELSFKADIYYKVLRRHGLISEADDEIKAYRERASDLSNWISGMEPDELPFT